MSKALPWFPFFPIDWLTSPTVLSMTHAEARGYINLLCHAWQSEDCSLPDNEKALLMMSGLSGPNPDGYEENGRTLTEWEFARDTILTKFSLQNGRLYNPKLLSIFNEQKAKRELQQKAAASTNANRIGKRNAKRVGIRISKRALRASDSNDVSVSFSREVTTEFKQSANGSPALPQFGGEFPLTIAEIRKHDPAVDDFFVAKLANAVLQKCLSHKDFPQEDLSLVNDKLIADACKESYATGPAKHTVGLLLSRVPPIVITWGTAK